MKKKPNQTKTQKNPQKPQTKKPLWMVTVTGVHQLLITRGVILGAFLKRIIPGSFCRCKGKKKIRNAAVSIVQNVKLI